MGISLEDVFTDFQCLPPASEEDVRAAEGRLRKLLPPDYTAFLLKHNGGEGFVGAHYLILWKADELARFNEDYQVPTYAPGFLMFGSTGGGEGFAFDTRVSPYTVVQVPFVGMSLNDGLRVANSFTELLERMKETHGSLF